MACNSGRSCITFPGVNDCNLILTCQVPIQPRLLSDSKLEVKKVIARFLLTVCSFLKSNTCVRTVYAVRTAGDMSNICAAILNITTVLLVSYAYQSPNIGGNGGSLLADPGHVTSYVNPKQYGG